MRIPDTLYYDRYVYRWEVQRAVLILATIIFIGDVAGMSRHIPHSHFPIRDGDGDGGCGGLGNANMFGVGDT